MKCNLKNLKLVAKRKEAEREIRRANGYLIPHLRVSRRRASRRRSAARNQTRRNQTQTQSWNPRPRHSHPHRTRNRSRSHSRPQSWSPAAWSPHSSARFHACGCSPTPGSEPRSGRRVPVRRLCARGQRPLGEAASCARDWRDGCQTCSGRPQPVRGADSEPETEAMEKRRKEQMRKGGRVAQLNFKARRIVFAPTAFPTNFSVTPVLVSMLHRLTRCARRQDIKNGWKGKILFSSRTGPYRCRKN